jgi:hypothetical protein
MTTESHNIHCGMRNYRPENWMVNEELNVISVELTERRFPSTRKLLEFSL